MSVNDLLHPDAARFGAEIRAMGNTAHRELVGQRLQIAIEALGLSQTEVAKVLSISLPKLGNWLRGDNYPDEYLLTVLCDRYGLTMDYLYRGILAGMPASVADGLASARAASPAADPVAPAIRTRGKRKPAIA